MSDTSGTPSRRSRLDLPAGLVERFVAGARVAGVPASTLLHGWLTTAARYARDGQAELVPARSTAPPTTGPQKPVHYPASAAEAADIALVLRDIGSSSRAVAAACIEAFLAADASAVRMTWPRRRSALAA